MDFVYYFKTMDENLKFPSFLVLGKPQSNDHLLPLSLALQGMKHLLEVPEVTLDFVTILKVI